MPLRQRRVDRGAGIASHISFQLGANVPLFPTAGNASCRHRTRGRPKVDSSHESRKKIVAQKRQKKAEQNITERNTVERNRAESRTGRYTE